MTPSEGKRQYRLQEWNAMVQDRAASGLSIKAWCMEHGISENVYYYRLKMLRKAACAAFEQVHEPALAELPVATKSSNSAPAQIRITMKAGTVEISNVGAEMLAQVLKVMSHVE